MRTTVSPPIHDDLAHNGDPSGIQHLCLRVIRCTFVIGWQHANCLSAGVIGLTCALNLSAKPGIRVTVLAKHMPGDYDIEYASPWAGANYLP